MSDLANVTRVVIITYDGIGNEYWADEWTPSLQDDGKTLKLFATGNGTEARNLRAKGLRKWLEGPHGS